VAFLTPIRIVVLLLTAASLTAGESNVIDEYRVKAAFLYNFVKFVEWPADAFTSPSDPIRICVLGNPFGARLDETVNGKQVDQRNLQAREIFNIAEASGCHILFVAGGKKRVADMLGSIKEKPILTVGEIPSFGAEGGIIAFRVEKDRIRFEINVRAADRARLRISSKLLSLAEIVREESK
jgi:hypothetical protein